MLRIAFNTPPDLWHLLCLLSVIIWCLEFQILRLFSRVISASAQQLQLAVIPRSTLCLLPLRHWDLLPRGQEAS